MVSLSLHLLALPYSLSRVAHYVCGRNSVLLWWRCVVNLLYVYTSGFVDDVMFSHNGPYGALYVYSYTEKA